MATQQEMFGLFSFMALDKPAQSRARFPFVMTLLPGAPAQRAAMATVAVGTQARDAVRRERQVASAVVSAAEAIAEGADATTAFAAQPALRDLNPAELATRFDAAFPDDDEDEEEVGAEATTEQLQTALQQATGMLVEAIVRQKGQLFTAEQAEQFSEYLALIPDEIRVQIVKPTEVE